MCWIISGKPILHIATKNLLCYKILESKPILNLFFVTSFFYDKRYLLNKIYRTDINLKQDKNLTQITNGFHSYSPNLNLTVSEVLYKLTSFSPYAIMENKYSPIHALYVCKIPKGSQYYINEKGEIVSNQIMISRKHIHLKDLDCSLIPLKYVI